MPNRFKKYQALTKNRQRALRTAFRMLGYFRIALAWKPFKLLVENLEVSPGNASSTTLQKSAISIARDIAWAVRAAAWYAPWRSTCLVQALAAQHMLQSSGVPGVLYLGASTAPGKEPPTNLDAHAWVKCGDEFITGEFESSTYMAIATFSWK